VLVALNMSGTKQTVNFDLSKKGFSSAKGLVATEKSAAKGETATLGPYGVFIGQLSK